MSFFNTKLKTISLGDQQLFNTIISSNGNSWTKEDVKFSASGISWDGTVLQLAGNSSCTFTAYDIPTDDSSSYGNRADKLLYIRLMIAPKETNDLTFNIQFGNKSASANVTATGQIDWRPDIKGGTGNSVSVTITNNNGTTMRSSSNYFELYFARIHDVNLNKKGGTGGTGSTKVYHYFPYSGITAPIGKVAQNHGLKK